MPGPVRFPIDSCSVCKFFHTYPVEDNMIETECEKECFKRGDGYDPGSSDQHPNCPFAGRGSMKVPAGHKCHYTV